MINKYSCYLFIIFTICSNSLVAQEVYRNTIDTSSTKYHIKQINSDNGLPQDHTYHIYKDKNDFIWVLTTQGFFSYDGYLFKEVSIVSKENVIKERPVSHYQKEGEVFVTYEMASSIEGQRNFLIKNLTTGEEKKINNRVNLSFQQKISKVFKNRPYVRNIYGTDTLGFIITDAALWLNKFTPSKDILEKSKLPFKTQLKPPEYRNSAICDNELFTFKGLKKTDAFKAISYIGKTDLQILKKEWPIEGDQLTNSKGQFVDLEKCHFLNTRQGSLKYIYYVVENTLYRLEKQSERLLSKRLVSDISFITKKTSINFIYSSPDANTIFITTEGEGIYQLNRQYFQNPFPKDDIYAHLEIKPDSFFIGMLKSYEFTLEDVKNREKFNTSGEKGNVFTLKQDQKGKIWLLDKSKGLFYFDMPSQKAVKYLDLKNTKEILMVRNDNSLGMRKDSSIVFYKDGQFETIIDFDNYRSHYVMVEDQDGFIWTGGSGLHLIDPKTKTIKDILEPSHIVRTIYVTKNNTILAGTYGQGIYKYKDGQVTKLPIDNRAYLKFAHCFMEDALGFFWITTNRGLFKVDGEAIENYKEGGADPISYYYYDKTDGFAGNEFNGGCTPCGIITHNGNFSFPSMKGLVQFNPLIVPMEFPKAHIHILDTKIANKDTTFIANSVFPPDFKNFTFRLTTPYFGKKENLQLSYRVDGFTDEWTSVERGEKIEITTLSSGSYILEARYPRNRSNSFEYLKIPFTVAPFYYETPRFKLLVLIVLIGFLYLFSRWRTQKIVASKMLLEKEVAIKTKSLEESLQVIEQNNESLVKDNLLKHKLISIATHNISGPLNFMGKVSKRLLTDFDKYPKTEVKQQLSLIKNTSNEIFQMLEGILTWIKYQREEIQTQQEEIHLKTLVEITIGPYESMVIEKEITLSNNISNDFVIQSDKRFITLILQNLIHNALKFTHKSGKIMIGIEKDPQFTIIYVQDTGVGMTKERIKQVTDGVILHSHLGTSEESGQGLGLSIVKELLPKINGHLAIESELNKGSIFKIKLKSVPK